MCERLGISLLVLVEDGPIDRELVLRRCEYEAVRMRVIDERSYAEIGERLGRTEAATPKA